MKNNNEGAKWVNYAKAFSIFVAAILSIFSLIKSCQNEKVTEVQGFEIESSKAKIIELKKELSNTSNKISRGLSFLNIVNGDTVLITEPTYYGKLDIDIPEEYKLYGVIKIENNYSFMPTPVDVEANGNWEYKFSINSGLGDIAILLVLCNREAQDKLSVQFQQGVWRVNSISEFEGMKIVGSVKVFIK